MLLPEQLDRFWPVVKYAVEECFKDVAQKQNLINNILQSLLTSRMHAWIATEDQDSIDAIAITSVVDDSALPGGIVRIYMLYAFKPLKSEFWEEGWNTLEAFARKAGCVQVDTFSTNAKIISQAELFGWKSEQHLYKEL